jgi:hypothetical protein
MPPQQGRSEAPEPLFEPFHQAKVSVNGQAAFGDTPGGRNPAIEEKQIRFCVAVEPHVRLGWCSGAVQRGAPETHLP